MVCTDCDSDILCCVSTSTEHVNQNPIRVPRPVSTLACGGPAETSTHDVRVKQAAERERERGKVGGCKGFCQNRTEPLTTVFVRSRKVWSSS